MNINYFYGKSCRSNEGYNKELKWNEFIKLFDNPIIQNIELSKIKEMLNLKNQLQSIHISARTEQQKQELRNIQNKISKYKDVHYIIGGKFINNFRSNGDDKLLFRNLIALDIDNADSSIWDKIKSFNSYEYILHTSFSHTPENPKLRLFFPVKKIENKIEYETIVKNFILDMGFSVQSKNNLSGEVDAASIKFNQLMFLPNIPKNAEYIFKHNKGNILDISKYKVEHTQQSINNLKITKKIQSPYNMKDTSIIKKFCIKYNIHDTISKFLSNIYIDRDNDRYTFSEGSSKLGAVVYPDEKGNQAVYLYTNHGTDPVNDCHCHNSFDLVKTHMFNGNLNETMKFVKNLFPNNSNTHSKSYQQSVDNTVDIFEKINNYLSDKKHDSEDIQLSDSSFLDDNYQHGYYMVKQGFCKRYINKDFYYDKVIIPTKVYPTKIFLVDNVEEVEFNNNLYVDNDTFSSISKFKTWLSQLGKFIYFDGDTKDLTALQKYISIYNKFSKLEINIGTSKLGWSKDYKNFNPYTDNKLFIKDDTQLDYLLECFNVEGNYNEWKTNIDKYNKNDVFRAIFNTSLSSPLIELIRRPPIWLHHYEKANTGKTPTAFAAASIWAKPGESFYTPNFSATKAGLEFMWNTLNNLPCILQDTQNLDKTIRDNLNDVIYDMFNGTGKIRGTVTGKNQKIKNWKLSMITNGEQKILQGNEFEGATKRLIEITGLPFENRIEAKKARDFFQDNYGFYGKEFIKTVIKYKNEVKKLCLQVEQEINNDLNIETHIESISTLIVCDYIFNKYCLKKPEKVTIDNSIEWGLRILKQLPYKSTVDKTTIALLKINEFILSDTHRFRPECPYGRVGWFKDGNVYFYPNQFKKLLIDWDIPESRFLKDIKEMGIILLDKDNNPKPVKHNNKTIRAITFTNIEINSLIENIQDYR